MMLFYVFEGNAWNGFEPLIIGQDILTESLLHARPHNSVVIVEVAG